MNKPLNLNIRVSGSLGKFVTHKVSGDGDYDNYSEYVRDLIRKDKNDYDRKIFEIKKAELQKAFASRDEDYLTLSAKDIIQRNRTL
ncbi:ribbon-helix-helix domain-containing protein [Robiginitomaculum antarcticum]|uniref:ribbon-helix-helix domain-containing protein n=1 Tax=Robiginitomaculum antarcticum TaxID=437507 RepID=UPI0003782025|nr:hypothetical protein [Robiginitomaculum antarcticum]